jgi:ubiquinone/menaquinone biosynthesis C-methylase UbiE
MKKILTKHTSAKASHYTASAPHYDAFNAAHMGVLHHTLHKILQKNSVQSVVDVSCGTGAQVFWLLEHGYSVWGFDINAAMLKKAKEKAKQKSIGVKFCKGDMRTLKTQPCDAVISMFNAVGHLTRQDFIKAMRNAYQHLNQGGVYVFDIFNLQYLMHKDTITRLTIDWFKAYQGETIRDIQYSTINEKGVLASYTTSIAQGRIREHAQTLQVYSSLQLKTMLRGVGFKKIQVLALDGSTFKPTRTERMFAVAHK